MSSHKRILDKKQLASLRSYLFDCFRLPYEHYGFENAKTTDEIVKLSIRYCEQKNFISRAYKVNLFFRDQFLLKCVSPVMSLLKTKYYMSQKQLNFPTEKEYRAAEGTSQSSLGYLVRHPKYYYHKVFSGAKEPRKDYFVIGGALDNLLTSPADFAKTYIEEPEDSPNSAMMLALCNEYVKQRYENKCDEEMSFQMAYNESGYSSTPKAIYKKFCEPEVQTYIKFLAGCKGKEILKKKEAMMVRHMA